LLQEVLSRLFRRRAFCRLANPSETGPREGCLGFGILLHEILIHLLTRDAAAATEQPDERQAVGVD
jgi:hypothetical protein